MRRTPLANFWLLQLAGWTGFYVSMAFSRMGRFPLSYMLTSKVLLTALGVGASLVLRAILRPLLARQMRMVSVVAVCTIASFILAAAWTAAFNVLVIPIGAAMLGRAESIGSLFELFYGSVYHAFSLGAWGFLYLGFKHHQAWQAERERALIAERQAANARLRALQYQLNPHFFFNTLNAISTLVTERRNDEASAMIARLGDFLRATLHRDTTASVSLRDELAFTQRYLDIERIRFEHRLVVAHDVDDDALDAAVPVLLLQPLVENAVRHGIAPLEQGGSIVIAAARTSDRDGAWLEISIDNDAPQPRSKPDGGIGIANVRERLEMLYGPTHRFSAGFVSSRYHARIALPFTAAAPAAAPKFDAPAREPAHA